MADAAKTTTPASSVSRATKKVPVPFQRRSIVAVQELTLKHRGRTDLRTARPERLVLGLYIFGERERLPTLIRRLKFLEDKLNIPLDQRIPNAAR